MEVRDGARLVTGPGRDLRDIDLREVLGRPPVHFDPRAVGELVRGRSVLVTGAGGSIGSELCRLIAPLGPSNLHMLDRDESGLLETQLSLTGEGLLESDEFILADIRDPAAVLEAFRRARPSVVFHAAALKHLPLLEAYPAEALKTNVLGTLNVLAAAADVGVGTFVNISTDKAADPTSALGHSKRLAERLTAHYARHEPGNYVSVRFGNVLGSRGSVVHTLISQIRRGFPISVTHPEVERYFMLIPEACQLVLEAARLGGSGEVMVLEMGEPVRILDMAKTLIALSGRTDVLIQVTGLRRGEKLSEVRFAPDETHVATSNPLVSCVAVPPLDPAVVQGMADADVQGGPLQALVGRAEAVPA